MLGCRVCGDGHVDARVFTEARPLPFAFTEDVMVQYHAVDGAPLARAPLPFRCLRIMACRSCRGNRNGGDLGDDIRFHRLHSGTIRFACRRLQAPVSTLRPKAVYAARVRLRVPAMGSLGEKVVSLLAVGAWSLFRPVRTSPFLRRGRGTRDRRCRRNVDIADIVDGRASRAISLDSTRAITSLTDFV